MKAKTSDFFSQRLTFCSAIRFYARSYSNKKCHMKFQSFQFCMVSMDDKNRPIDDTARTFKYTVLFVFFLLFSFFFRSHNQLRCGMVCYQLHIASDEMAKLFNGAIFGSYDVIYNTQKPNSMISKHFLNGISYCCCSFLFVFLFRQVNNG